MRGARRTLGKTYRKNRAPAGGCQIMWKRLRDNLVREKLGNENQITDFCLYDYDEYARIDSSLTLMK